MWWIRRWEVTIRWARAEDSPKATTKWVTHVDTPEQLRRLVQIARADRYVTGYRYRPIHTTQGDPPMQCRRSHPFSGGSATRPALRWVLCDDCPGHEVYYCRWRDETDGLCGDVLVDPPPGPDCVPAVNAPRKHS